MTGMPRALWSGAISFGLVNVPVRMYTAISEHNVHFNLLRAKGDASGSTTARSPTRAARSPDDKIVKGYEVSDGEYVTLTDEEIAAAHVEGDKVIEIHDFVPLERSTRSCSSARTTSAPPRAPSASTRCSPGARDLGPRRHRELRLPRPRPARCLRVKDGALLLERMYFADEIRDGDGVLPDRKRAVDKRELKLAIDLIERMQGSFDHSAYHDRYRDRLMAIIDKKRKGETITAPEVEERKAPRRPDGGARGEPLDAAARASRGSGRRDTARAGKAAARRSPSRPVREDPGRRPPSRGLPLMLAARSARSCILSAHG